MINSASCLLLLIPLCACGVGEGTGAKLLERQRAIDPPYMWLIKDIDPHGRVRSATWACADTPRRQSFTRTNLEFPGCRTVGAAVEKPGLVSLRCVVDGRAYAYAASVRGDVMRQFQLTVAVTPLDGLSGGAAQTRTYYRDGPCPATWAVGVEADATGPAREPPS